MAQIFLEYQKDINSPIERYELTEENRKKYGYVSFNHYKQSLLKNWIGINKRIVIV